MSDKEYFSPGILAMGDGFERAMWIAFFVRNALMAMGLLVFLFAMSMGFSPTEMIDVVYMFTARLREVGPEAISKFAWIIMGAWGFCFLTTLLIGWKGFQKNVDGNQVAMDLFDDLNHVIVREEDATTKPVEPSVNGAGS